MEIADFLQTVVTTDAGYFCLAFKDNAAWQESFYKWPQDIDKIMAEAIKIREYGNVYFSSHLFSEPRSLKSLTLPSRTIQADLDYADTATIPILPTILVETSPTRHQGFWVLDKPMEPAKIEEYGRRIAYGIPDCDRTGWTAGHKVRLPNTYNFKYVSKNLIEIVGVSLRELRPDLINHFPELTTTLEEAKKDVDWIENDPQPLQGVTNLELLQSLKGIMPARIFSQYTRHAKDRSAALWAFTTESMRAGLNREQTFWLARSNANNKFAGRPSGDFDLRRDILRAEQYIQSRSVDLKAVIMDLRYTRGKIMAERRKQMADLVINYMRERGEFVHCRSNELWYLRKDTGKPIAITIHSEWLLSYLSHVFGFNSTEAETKFVVAALVAYTHNLPQSLDLQALSYYDRFSKKLLIHTGARDILHVSKDSIETHPNGYGSIVFRWNDIAETFALDYTPLPNDAPWWELLFRPQLSTLIGITADEAIVVLRAYMLFILLRNLGTTRPLLGLLGQPGSGKTTTAKRIYRIIYGRYASISDLTDEADFDITTSRTPIVAYDNCDNWTPWLANKLATSTTDTMVSKRKLYTDTDMIYMTRQAMVVLTAHNPRFTREDVMDRMLIFMFSRLPKHGSETVMMEQLSTLRNQIWTQMIHDIQKTLAIPRPLQHEVPAFRIEDFASMGLWFSRAHSPEMEAMFRAAMLKLQGGQRNFNIEQEQLLVSAIRKYVASAKEHAFKKIDTLHSTLLLCSADQDQFRKIYKQPMHLGKKLWVLQDSLRQMFEVDWMIEQGDVSRSWRIAPKGDSINMEATNA